jgi:hypothetical protein
LILVGIKTGDGLANNCTCSNIYKASLWTDVGTDTGIYNHLLPLGILRRIDPVDDLEAEVIVQLIGKLSQPLREGGRQVEGLSREGGKIAMFLWTRCLEYEVTASYPAVHTFESC